MQKRSFRTHARTNSSDWLVWMPGRGRPRIAARCDECRRQKHTAAFCQRKGHLAAAAAGAANAGGAAAPPVPPGRRVERTRRTARRPGSSSLRTIRSCSHFPSRSVVRAGRLAAGEHPAARATIPPRQPQAFQAAGCSARRLAAGRSRRGHLRRRGLDCSSAPRPTSVQVPHVSDGRRRERTIGKDSPSPRWPSFELRRAWGCRRRVCCSHR